MPPAWILFGYAVAFVALAIVTLMRQSGVPAWNTVWAEDGLIFYQQALIYSVPKALTTLYAGYPQLFPRLPAEIATLLPIKDLAPFLALTGAASLSAIALLVFHCSRGHLKSAYARGILVAAMILLPYATWELLDNVVNVPWWLFFATFWVLLWRPTSMAGRAIAALTCFMAVASDPLVGLFLPIVFVRFFALRRFSENAASAGFLAGLVFQAVFVLQGQGQSFFTSSSLHRVPEAFLVRVGLGWLTGVHLTTHVISFDPTIGMVIGGLVLLGLLAFAVSGPGKGVRGFSIVAMALAIVTYAVPVWLRGAGSTLATTTSSNSSRYVATPILLLVSILLVRLESISTDTRKRVALISLSLPLLSPFWVMDFRIPNGRSDGPAWSSQLDLARARCAGPVRRYQVSWGLSPNKGTVKLATSPLIYGEFGVGVPCSRLVKSKATPTGRYLNSPVTVLKPLNGARITGTTVLEASSPRATSLKFRIYFGYFGFAICNPKQTSQKWVCRWNSKGVPNGSYELRAEGSNVIGNAYSPTVKIRVMNPPQPHS